MAYDHEHCKSVKVFHYTIPSDENDFHDKMIHLGRHFTDKGRMRKLIVAFSAACNRFSRTYDSRSFRVFQCCSSVPQLQYCLGGSFFTRMIAL